MKIFIGGFLPLGRTQNPLSLRNAFKYVRKADTETVNCKLSTVNLQVTIPGEAGCVAIIDPGGALCLSALADGTADLEEIMGCIVKGILLQ